MGQEQSSPSDVDGRRRELMQQAACVAGAWAASGCLPVVAGPAREHPRALLVDARGDPFPARRLETGEPYLFNYPFVASPVFLLEIGRPVAATELVTEARQRYLAPGGTGPTRSIVAFSAICAHKLMYPTPALSFIGVREGRGEEPRRVIHCCGDNSQYDPTQGARVMAGPAPQPLAAVLLEWDARTDRLYATGTRGGEMFDAFFEKYAFKLETELGPRARDTVADTTTVLAARAYSRQWQTCKA
jgi:Rieske Fe-S protein